MRLAAGLRPDLLGELKRSPRPCPVAVIGGCQLLRGKGRGKGKERERGGNRGKGKHDLHPTLFLGPD